MVILGFYWAMLDHLFEILKVIFRILVGLDEDDFQLILLQYNSSFIRYEILPGIFSNTELSEVTYTIADHEGTLQIENNDISMKTKPLLTRFGGTFLTSSFDEKLIGFHMKNSILHFWVSHQMGTINLLMQFMLIAQVYT